ncbi:hypothetical protein ZHAS_00020784 [Anopheles sinensis]|uniref:Uncharacterized protein n=1 Tax=Anopheles sinensis TaxID=74873 RepID=A0A084WQP1_ANOSI|nr:hypothetical protein ZHAS_00020784 [Anopheles sinensis]
MTLLLVLLFLKNICVFLNKLVLRCYNSFLIHPNRGHLEGKHGHGYHHHRGGGGGSGGGGGGGGGAGGGGHSGYGSGLGVRPRRTRRNRAELMQNRDVTGAGVYGDSRAQYYNHY